MNGRQFKARKRTLYAILYYYALVLGLFIWFDVRGILTGSAPAPVTIVIQLLALSWPIPLLAASIRWVDAQSDGLLAVDHLGRRREFRWADITGKRAFLARGVNGPQRVVKLKTRGKRLTLTDNLNGFDQLASIIDSKVPKERESPPSFWDQLFYGFADRDK